MSDEPTKQGYRVTEKGSLYVENFLNKKIQEATQDLVRALSGLLYIIEDMPELAKLDTRYLQDQAAQEVLVYARAILEKYKHK